MADRVQFRADPNEMPLCYELTYQLDERDFSSVSMGKDHIGAPALSLCFSGSGRSKFERLVSRNVGRFVVFLGRGKVLNRAKIMSADVPVCATIEGNVSAEDLSVLQRAINGR